MTKRSLTRREFVAAGTAAGLATSLGIAATESMRTRPIPASGEQLPVIGLGTWRVFDVSGSAEEIEVRKAIVEMLIEKGASLLDSSPMYNRAEEVIGDVIEAGINRDDLFLATKVWTDSKSSGERQMRRSADLMNAGVIDLMQVHNLRDLDTHMETIRDWQADGRIRYNGITDYRASALDEMEAAIKKHRPQFIQINYSLGERQAEERLLPLAQDMGIAVLINRPYLTGRLFRAVGNSALPDWASEFAASWGQFFLKFVVAHPSVTCVIPATSKPHHMADNLGAGFGPLPDEATRQKMAAYFDAI
jgi:diketogulonate reductase-like aldo/keto reductase